MTAPVWPGWVALPRGPEPKWDRVKHARLPADPIPDELRVHAFVKARTEYVPDRRDRWQTPALTWRIGRGDCEDIAILDRAILLARGWPEGQLSLMILWDYRLGEHAVLSVGPGLIWDPLVADPLSAGDLAPFAEPMFAFTETAAWAYGKRAQ